jgi:hypothetical protein
MLLLRGGLPAQPAPGENGLPVRHRHARGPGHGSRAPREVQQCSLDPSCRGLCAA